MKKFENVKVFTRTVLVATASAMLMTSSLGFAQGPSVDWNNFVINSPETTKAAQDRVQEIQGKIEVVNHGAVDIFQQGQNGQFLKNKEERCGQIPAAMEQVESSAHLYDEAIGLLQKVQSFVAGEIARVTSDKILKKRNKLNIQYMSNIMNSSAKGIARISEEKTNTQQAVLTRLKNIQAQQCNKNL